MPFALRYYGWNFKRLWLQRFAPVLQRAAGRRTAEESSHERNIQRRRDAIVLFGVLPLVSLACAACMYVLEGAADGDRWETECAGLLLMKQALANASEMRADARNSLIAIVDQKLEPCEYGPDWTFVGSLYYWLTVMSTIGYGTFVPVTDGGRVFTIIFALPSIAVFAKSVTIIGEYISAAICETATQIKMWKKAYLVQEETSGRRRSLLNAVAQMKEQRGKVSLPASQLAIGILVVGKCRAIYLWCSHRTCHQPL